MKNWTRRQMLKSSLYALSSVGLAGALWRQWHPSRSQKQIPVRILGPSASAGHKLRDGFQFPKPTEFLETDVLILGGGMAGLSAGWRLQKKGIHNFKILELETEVGGNSRSGQNEVSKYPWGAHYLTLLNPEAKFAQELYEDLGVITGQQNHLPVYNEYFLCQAPHERLFIYQKWQEGLLPKIGVSADEDLQAKAFFARVEQYRFAQGKDDKPAFTIPLDLSSRDPSFLHLDKITMAEYLQQNGWTSKPLHWYINYCCRDDYGTPYDQTSAWAGLHYFCSRRGKADGVEGSAVLTWPEGNGWMVQKLKDRLKKQIVSDAMGVSIEQNHSSVTLNVWSEKTQTVTQWKSKSLILAVPRFLAPHLSPSLAESQEPLSRAVSYSPWMVANVTLSASPANDIGVPPAWDNVFYQGRSLGYVVATHQLLTLHTDKTVWTYYRPLDEKTPAEERKRAFTTSAEEWKSMILADLSLAHPQISELVESIDVWIWGHAMIKPTPGFIWGEARNQMQKKTGRIHFAHSDMSGISIFEEANYHGVMAADEVIKSDLS